MLFPVIIDAIVAGVVSFVIIYFFAFVFNCIFFADNKFSLNGFVQYIRNINREEK